MIQDDLLIQEFIPEIQTNGEVSMVFFNKKFSHAIRKRAAKNEFRIHSEYGGTRESISISLQSLEYGKNLLNQIQEDLLYARVEIVETQKGPVLIELEITDPMLFLATCNEAPKRFADAIESQFRG